MVSSIGSSSQDDIYLMMSQLLQQMSAADTDGVSGLSKNEISSINTGGDAGGSAFLQALTNQFDTLDANGDGSLSTGEIASFKGPMGPPPGMSIDSGDNSDSASLSGSVSTTDDLSNSDDAVGGTEKSNSTTTTGTTSTDADYSASTSDLVENLLEALMQQFSESFDSNNESASDKDIDSLAASADTDGDGAVSLGELSSLNTGKDSQKAGLVNDLVKNFDNYDTDADGELSKIELENAIPKQKYSAQELSAMAETLSNTEGSSVKNILASFSSLSGSFASKLLSNYGSDALSALSSIM